MIRLKITNYRNSQSNSISQRSRLRSIPAASNTSKEKPRSPLTSSEGSRNSSRYSSLLAESTWVGNREQTTNNHAKSNPRKKTTEKGNNEREYQAVDIPSVGWIAGVHGGCLGGGIHVLPRRPGRRGAAGSLHGSQVLHLLPARRG